MSRQNLHDHIKMVQTTSDNRQRPSLEIPSDSWNDRAHQFRTIRGISSVSPESHHIMSHPRTVSVVASDSFSGISDDNCTSTDEDELYNIQSDDAFLPNYHHGQQELEIQHTIDMNNNTATRHEVVDLHIVAPSTGNNYQDETPSLENVLVMSPNSLPSDEREVIKTYSRITVSYSFSIGTAGDDSEVRIYCVVIFVCS